MSNSFRLPEMLLQSLWCDNSAQLGFALREFCTLDAMPFELTHRVRVLTGCAWKFSLAFNAFRNKSAYPVVVCFLVQVPESNRCIQKICISTCF